MKGLFTAALALAALALAPLQSVAAAPAAQSAAPQQAGALRAAGKGELRLVGRGLFELRLFGEGTLVIPDAAELHVGLHGQGNVHYAPNGALVVNDFQGRVVVGGQGVRARFGGGKVALRARGHGHAKLTGVGRYAANGVTGTWSVPGQTVDF